MIELLIYLGLLFLVLLVILLALLITITSGKIVKNLDPHLHYIDDENQENVSNQENTTKKTL